MNTNNSEILLTSNCMIYTIYYIGIKVTKRDLKKRYDIQVDDEKINGSLD